MTCVELRAHADTSVGGELAGEAHDPAVTEHLDRCAACRAELQARTNLRRTLQRAYFTSAALAPDDQLIRRVHTHIATLRRSRQRRVAPWMWAAAVLTVSLLGGWVFRTRPDSTVPSSMVAALAEEAAADHRDCALNHALDQPVLSLADAAQRYDPAYGRLRGAVERLPEIQSGALVIAGAHWCVLHGRHFGHVILTRGPETVSVLLTPAEVAQTGREPAACAGPQEFAVACWEAGRFAAFVVSSLPAADNMRIARNLAPGLRAYLLQVAQLLQTPLRGDPS